MSKELTVKELTVKELTVKEQQVLAAHASMADELFDDIQIDASDILIPKLLLMQAPSAFVAEEKARIGDYVSSVSGAKIGSVVEPIEIIPFYHTKCIDIINTEDNNSLIHKEPFTPETAALPWEDMENGVKIKRFKRLDFFCLVPKQMAAGSILPMVVSFRSSSYKAGQAILSAWMETRERNRAAKAEGRLQDIKLPFHQSFVLGGQKLTNEKKNTYAVASVQPGQDVSEEHQRLCLQWLETVKANKVKVDETGEEENTTASDISVEPEGTGKF